MIAALDIQINYGQLVLYLPSVERPGHRWEDDHLRQGFCWSPGIVSFSVPEHAEMCRVTIDLLPGYTPAFDAISAVRVPFAVTESPAMLGSVFHYDEVDIPRGSYELVFEARPGEGSYRLDDIEEEIPYSYGLRLIFIPAASPTFRILKAGGPVTSRDVLRETAELA